MTEYIKGCTSDLVVSKMYSHNKSLEENVIRSVQVNYMR